MAYDILAHVLLCESARILSDAELAAHGRIAEQVLGLAGAALEGDAVEAARDAVVLQVNYQIDELPDRAWGALKEDERVAWFEEHDGVNPVALRMARRLTGRSAAVVKRALPTAELPPYFRYPFEIT